MTERSTGAWNVMRRFVGSISRQVRPSLPVRWYWLVLMASATYGESMLAAGRVVARLAAAAGSTRGTAVPIKQIATSAKPRRVIASITVTVAEADDESPALSVTITLRV